MGKWNRRYLPRKKCRHYDYEDPPLSPPRHYSAASGGVPSWEIDYCKSARVPWHQVLASKKYIYCYPSVLNWDASAGEEALQEAKQRYWAIINGLPCNNPLPNPDIYIDDIDWNPYMDPELMAELDLPVFDPDKAQNDEKLETINEEIDKNQYTNDNPWERNHEQGAASLKDVVNGWGTWGDSVNMSKENPWEHNCSQVVDSLKDNAWRSGNECWGNECGNSWDNNNSKNVAVRQEGWGNGEKSSWNWNSGNLGNYGDSGDNYYPKERGWTENKNGSWGNGCGNSWDNNNNKNVAVRQEGWGNREKNSMNWNDRNLGNYEYSGDNYKSKERGWRENKNESWGNECGNSWHNNNKSVAVIQEGWGNGEKSSWNWNSGNFGNYGYSGDNYHSKERGWRENKNDSWSWKEAEYQTNELKNWDSRSFRRGRGSFRGGFRKREGSFQHTSKFKSSRYHADTYGNSHQF